MSDENSSFLDLLARARTGDEQATIELLKTYEPNVRRVIRVRLRDPRLRRQMDSIDISQSVFGDFFVRLVHGQYDLNSPAQLVQLLAVMARNKLVSHVNKQQAARRDVRRMELLDDPAVEMAGREATPSRIVSARELLKNFRERLSPEERLLADARAAGRSWVELGREQGEDPDVLRKRFARAVERVAGQLGLESQSDV